MYRCYYSATFPISCSYFTSENKCAKISVPKLFCKRTALVQLIVKDVVMFFYWDTVYHHTFYDILFA